MSITHYKPKLSRQEIILILDALSATRERFEKLGMKTHEKEAHELWKKLMEEMPWTGGK
jgi:hypothetical protein